MLKHCPVRDKFYTVLESCGFTNVVQRPTSITPTSASLLDLFITNIQIRYVTAGALISDRSDLLPTLYLIKNTKKKYIVSY